MSANGELTADIVKNAMLSATDKINEDFESMPMTFEQLGTEIKNNALMIFQPILNKINELANSEDAQQIIDDITAGLQGISTFAGEILGFIIDIAGFVSDNWGIIAPIVLAIAAAMLVLTAAQWAHNISMAASPLMWVMLIIIAVIASIYVIIGIINKVTGQSISATGVIFGAINVVIQAIKNVGLRLANVGLAAWAIIQNIGSFIKNVIEGIVNVFWACVDNIKAAFVNTWIDIKIKFWDFVEVIISGVRSIALKINDLLGVFGVHIDTAGLDAQLQEIANKKSEREDDKLDYKDIGAAWNEGFHTNEYKDVGEAFNTFEAFSEGWRSKAWDDGYNFGQGLEDKIGGLFNTDGLPKEEDYPYDPTEEIPPNVKNINDNTDDIKDSVDISAEDLKYLRDLAEMEVINRFTTAEIHIEQTNNNKISSDMDVDGINENLNNGLREAIEYATEGVHA